MIDASMTDVLVVNPLPWARTYSGPVPQYVVAPRGVADDPTAARHFQDRDPSRDHPAAFDNGDKSEIFETETYWLPPTDLPGFGYRVVPPGDLESLTNRPFDERSIVETEGYRITFDRDRGGVASWYDTDRHEEWVDNSTELPFASVIHERVADTDHDQPRQLLYRYDSNVNRRIVASGTTRRYDGFQSDWHAHREQPTKVLRHRVAERPGGYEIRQRLAIPSLPSAVSIRMVIPESGASMVVEATWEMGLETHPESTYVAFPFALDDPTPYVDVGGQAMRPGHDQLSGSCHDYYTAQRWAAFGGTERSVTLGCPINPMVQFGDFHFADNQSTASPERALLLGWVTSNYWDTNFRAHQPGLVRAQYHVHLHDHPFDEGVAHRRGTEAGLTDPVVQTMGEIEESNYTASTGCFLDLPEPPVLVHHIRPATRSATRSETDRENDGRMAPDMSILLQNASDAVQPVSIGSGVISIDGAILVAPSEGETTDIAVSKGTVEFRLEPRERQTVWLRCSGRNPPDC